MRAAVRSVAVVSVVAVLLFAGICVGGAGREPALPEGARADRVVVVKSAHTMTLLRGGVALKTYKVALGRGGAGAKVREGDNRVPEGVYPVVARNERSAFHRALRIGYPNAAQVVEAQRAGVRPGGDVMIHGLRNGLGWIGALHRTADWTRGAWQ